MYKIPKITLITVYDDNYDEMFYYQQRIWATYSDDILEQIEIIVIDNNSLYEDLTNQIILMDDYPIKLYRLRKYNYWAARNLGAAKASTDQWLFFFHMDKLIGDNIINILLRAKLKSNTLYRFKVKDKNEIERKKDQFSFIVHKNKFFQAGGYDENIDSRFNANRILMQKFTNMKLNREQFNSLYLLTPEIKKVQELKLIKLDNEKNFSPDSKPLFLSIPYKKIKC